jgi:hypothetical protein
MSLRSISGEAADAAKHPNANKMMTKHVFIGHWCLVIGHLISQ